MVFKPHSTRPFTVASANVWVPFREQVGAEWTLSQRTQMPLSAVFWPPLLLFMPSPVTLCRVPIRL